VPERASFCCRRTSRARLSTYRYEVDLSIWRRYNHWRNIDPKMFLWYIEWGKGNRRLGVCIKPKSWGNPPFVVLLWWALGCVHREGICSCVCYKLRRPPIIALLWRTPVCVCVCASWRKLLVCVGGRWSLYMIPQISEFERPTHLLQQHHQEFACATSLTFPYIAAVF